MSLENTRWIYFKLYLGNAIDRMDRLIVELGQAVPRLQGVEGWFYIRYFDEEGAHVRLRVKGAPDCCEPLRRELTDLCTRYLGGLHSVAPSDYYPMVTAPGFKETVERLTGGHNDVRLVKAIYEPEYHKFGGQNGMPIAERLFQASSEIACGILIDESRNLYSRKDMFPELMDAAFRAFAPGDDEKAFWHEYGFYWLSGKSLAAEDWRKKFFEKGRELAAQGVPVLPGQSGLSWEAYEHLKFDFLLQSPRRRNLEAMEIDAPADERGRLRFLLDRLHGLGFEPVVIDLTTDELRELGIWVVRAVIPGLMPMSSVQRGRFLGTPRLYEYPCRAGFGALDEHEINPTPQPFA